MLVSFIQLLVDNGVLGIPELSKLIFLSRAVRDATLDDTIWASLCNREFPNTKFLPRDIFFSKGHLWCYMQWKAGIAEQRPSRPLPPPSCTANDIVLYIHLKHRGKPFASVPILGELMETLVTEGSVDCGIVKPATLGKAEWHFTNDEASQYEKGTLETPLYAWWSEFDQREFDVSIHMLRLTDLAMSCVFSPRPGDRECLEGVKVHPKPGKVLTPQTEFDLSKGQQWSNLSFGPWSLTQSLPMKQTALAAEIKSRLPNPVVFSFDCQFSVVEGGLLAVTGFTIELMKMSGIDEDGHPETFDCRKEEASHGVTLLHILSELQGSDLPNEEDDDTSNGESKTHKRRRSHA